MLARQENHRTSVPRSSLAVPSSSVFISDVLAVMRADGLLTQSGRSTEVNFQRSVLPDEQGALE